MSRIQRLFNLSPTALRTKFIRRDIAEDWLDDSGRILLVGEAAHPLLVGRLAYMILVPDEFAVAVYDARAQSRG